MSSSHFISVPHKSVNQKNNISTAIPHMKSFRVQLVRSLLLFLLLIFIIYSIQRVIWHFIMCHEIKINECRTIESYANGTEIALFTAMEICRKLNVQWYIADGTLLALIRGQKSIPWDNVCSLLLYCKKLYA